jgi:hypothetical protein
MQSMRKEKKSEGEKQEKRNRPMKRRAEAMRGHAGERWGFEIEREVVDTKLLGDSTVQ